MGFNWVFVNPVQEPGLSGSLYSIKNYFALNPLFVNDGSDMGPDDQLRATIKEAGGLGLQMMTDLVINHCAVDSPLLEEHPQWFEWDKNGKVKHPWCMDGKRKVVWGDLARFDHEDTSDPEGLHEFILSIIDHLVGLGFRGFRCDAAYQLPPSLWERIISDTRRRHKLVVFAAETLGCTHEQTMETARAGFDFIFNSSKWWDFKSPWLLEQYSQTRTVAPSISFPESHDTLRLSEDLKGNINAMCQHYLFAAFFSSAVMTTMGFEFAFRLRPHVVKTRTSDWEETGIDLTGFIREVNKLKATLPILGEEARMEALHSENPDLLILLKRSDSDESSLLLIMNRDMDNPVELSEESPRELMKMDVCIKDVTPGSKNPVDTGKPLFMTLPQAGFVLLYGPSENA